MKICIPTATQDGKSAQVHEHFGSAPFFTLCDTEKNTTEIIDNANQHHSHGMCQPMSAVPGTVEDLLQQFVKGGLQELTIENACAQHGCH